MTNCFCRRMCAKRNLTFLEHYSILVNTMLKGTAEEKKKKKEKC